MKPFLLIQEKIINTGEKNMTAVTFVKLIADKQKRWKG